MCERQTERSDGWNEHPCQLHPMLDAAASAINVRNEELDQVRAKEHAVSILGRSISFEPRAEEVGGVK